MISDLLWKFFSSLKLALGLFIALIVSTMAGSIVLQRPIAEPGQLERAYSPETIHWLDLFGLLDVFHSWWFLLQLALVGVNVIVASIDMWPRFRSRMKSFDPVFKASVLPSFHAQWSHREQTPPLVEKLRLLIRKRFRNPAVRQEGGKYYLGAQSGKWAHLGVYVIHTGIILVLIGGLIISLKGFEGQIALSPGEEAGFYFDRKEPGKKVALDFTIRCLGARMEKYADGTPKAYFSDLEIVERGQVVAKKTIKVNDPLAYKGIYLYQATFGERPSNEKASFSLDIRDPRNRKTSTVVLVPNQAGKLPNGKGSLQVVDYIENVPMEIEGHRRDLGEAIKVALSEEGEAAKEVWLFKDYPDFDGKMRKGRYQLSFKNFSYDYEIETVTGLQVAKNPGIGITWTGSAILLTGLLATFLIPHRKLWFVVDDHEILVAAASHRHPETFARKVKKMIEEISSVDHPVRSPLAPLNKGGAEGGGIMETL